MHHLLSVWTYFHVSCLFASCKNTSICQSNSWKARAMKCICFTVETLRHIVLWGRWEGHPSICVARIAKKYVIFYNVKRTRLPPSWYLLSKSILLYTKPIRRLISNARQVVLLRQTLAAGTERSRCQDTYTTNFEIAGQCLSKFGRQVIRKNNVKE